jgi:hypothetical protein
VHELGKVEVDDFVTEGEEYFEPCRGGRVELDGVGKRGSALDRCCGRVECKILELGERTHKGQARSRKI